MCPYYGSSFLCIVLASLLSSLGLCYMKDVQVSLGLGAAWCGAGCALQFSRRPSSGSSRRSCLHPLVRSRLDEAERCENLRQLKSMVQQCMYAEECIQLAAVAMQTLKGKCPTGGRDGRYCDFMCQSSLAIFVPQDLKLRSSITYLSQKVSQL